MKTWRIIIAAVIQLSLAGLVHSQNNGASGALISELSSESWQDRDRAISKVIGDLANDRAIRDAVIALLEKENAYHENWHVEKRRGRSPTPLNDRFGEGYGEYYLNLVAKVIAFKDAKSIPVLVGALDVFAPEKALVNFGDAAVLATIDAYETTANDQRRAAIVRVLGRFAEKGISSAPLHQRAKNLVYRAADDSASPVQQAAIQNLHIFGKDEALKKLKKISDSDEHSFIRKKDGARQFPIREAAQREIKRLSGSR